MNIILKMSVRNLIRQKRRNLLLGISIAFGMGVLVFANAFGTGIVDLILNKMVERISGHILVKMIEKDGKDKKERKVIRDKDRITQAIWEHVEGVKAIHEQLTAHGKAIGNGKAMYAAIFGIEPDETFYRETRVAAGDLRDLSNPAIEHPVALYTVMAEKLNVRLHDVIRLKFQTLYGQVQIARFTVVAVIKADNPFFNSMIYCHLKHLKPLMGYQEHETSGLRVILENVTDAQRAIEQANRLHNTLSKEWNVLPRTFNQRESAQKYRELSLSNWQGAILDVQTVHEVVEDALEITSVMTIITFVGVVILFFVIQIGVVNLLRTTIRERIREIGTVRAIGMQRSDVRRCFVTEVLLLTIFAAVIGIILAIAAMKIFSSVPIDTGDSEMGFFLINQHLYFVTRPGDVLKDLVIIAGIAFLTSYFPARNAAKLSVAEALRHYE